MCRERVICAGTGKYHVQGQGNIMCRNKVISCAGIQYIQRREKAAKTYFRNPKQAIRLRF